ncbi:hypothetical protein [Streptomyces sp. NPDC001492]
MGATAGAFTPSSLKLGRYLAVREPLRGQRQHHLVDPGQPQLPPLGDRRLEPARLLQWRNPTTPAPAQARRTLGQPLNSARPKPPTIHQVLALYDTPPADGWVICADEFGPFNLQPRKGEALRPINRPRRLRATYNLYGGVMHMLAGLDLATGKIYRIESEFAALRYFGPSTAPTTVLTTSRTPPSPSTSDGTTPV